jgi:predicted AlkP superfamily phosphohydrolase/phosphomutase
MNFFCQTCSKHIPSFYYLGYIDPGTGYVFSSVIPLLFGFLTTFFVALFTYIMRRKKKIIIFILIGLLTIGILVVINKFISNNAKKNNAKNRIVVLGIDGMDPQILNQAIDLNLMPNIKELKEKGYYSKLETTTPPQSPVAWASFATGTNPSEHGIYDFVIRKPESYQLDLVWMDTIKSAIRTQPFWKKKDIQNIDTTILFLPNTFPPDSMNGRMISGMGTPDIGGSTGRSNFFTTGVINEKSRGNEIQINNVDYQTASIPGPKFHSFSEKKATYIPLTIKRDKINKQVLLTVQNQTVTLKEGEFSDWVKFKFEIDFFTKINGIGKFYLKQSSPQLELYLSPINFDPSNPIKEISYPESYSKELVKEYGLFYTQGIPFDVWALERGIFDDKAFQKIADSILAEKERIHFGELKKRKNGIFFSYFGITDTVSHMYWNNPEVILHYYKKIDEMVGKTMSQLNEKDTLIILSDHGFAGFDWEFNLNSWLANKGYLVLKNPTEATPPLLSDIDWGKTQAYAVGYNGIYLNLKGREGEGIIEQTDSQILEEKLKKDLLEIINPNDDSQVIKNVYTKEELNIKKDDPNSPDLFVGYHKGIRASWDTAGGATPKDIFTKRTGKWAGDHLFDSSEVPGVLISNKNLGLKNPKITDVIPQILKRIKLR